MLLDMVSADVCCSVVVVVAVVDGGGGGVAAAVIVVVGVYGLRCYRLLLSLTLGSTSPLSRQ
jgi:hypothetical protein